jgi:hypothetical protein
MIMYYFTIILHSLRNLLPRFLHSPSSSELFSTDFRFMIPPSSSLRCRTSSSHACDERLEPALKDHLLCRNISTTTSSMPSPSVIPCFQEGDILELGINEDTFSSSMSCWDLDLKDTGLIRDGSDLDRLDASKSRFRLKIC